MGNFIAQMRKERGLTQRELAAKLNVTDRAISNWERGLRLPDYSIIQDLCANLGISINELFSAKLLEEHEFKKNADQNLLVVLENSSFTLKDKITYYKDKWQKDHFFELVITIILIATFIIYGFIKDNGIQYLFIVLGFLSGLYENNRMYAYIENHVYNRDGLTKEDLKSSLDKLKDYKDVLKKFETKKEALTFLQRETELPQKECSKVYDFIMDADR